MERIPLTPKMYRNYISRRENDLIALEESVKSGSTDAFRKIGHQLMGNARTFGFDELEDLGVELHDVSIHTLKNEGPLLIERLNRWILKTKKALESNVST